ncbi:MAG: hypothetical protein QOC82_2788 [Frankiaceae bacterium]|jgi:hypothetical protein|nr:hypothetical protein [Frankiaceae bacterium]
MRTRLILAAALLAPAAAVIPAAHAGPISVLTPYCATTLQNVNAGVSSSCATQGPPPVECSSCGVRRTVNVVVTSGGADVKLLCDGLTYTTHVDGPGTGSVGAWGGLNCTTTLTATANGTIAAATSTASYVIISE